MLEAWEYELADQDATGSDTDHQNYEAEKRKAEAQLVAGCDEPMAGAIPSDQREYLTPRTYVNGAEVLYNYVHGYTVERSYLNGTFDLVRADGHRFEGVDSLNIMTAEEAAEGARSFEAWAGDQQISLGKTPKKGVQRSTTGVVV